MRSDFTVLLVLALAVAGCSRHLDVSGAAGAAPTGPGNSPPASGPGINVAIAGKSVGVATGLNFVSGTGQILMGSQSGGVITIEPAVDSAYIQTRSDHQSGDSLLCVSANGTPALTCSLNPTLNTYTRGMILDLVPDVGNTGSMTVNVDALGPVALKMPDGTTDPANGMIVAGQLYAIWYDGTVFRLPSTAASSAPPVEPGATTPCEPATRGQLRKLFGGPGVKDRVSVCAKDAAETYAWRDLY